MGALTSSQIPPRHPRRLGAQVAILGLIFGCHVVTAQSKAICGNRIPEPGEQCDDGNNVNGDGCRNDCQRERCGDGILGLGEQCDDGNDEFDDGCRPDCLFALCGDEHLDPGEECDDGNNVNGDGCRPNCTAEVCGDHIVDQPV